MLSQARSPCPSSLPHIVGHSDLIYEVLLPRPPLTAIYVTCTFDQHRRLPDALSSLVRRMREEEERRLDSARLRLPRSSWSIITSSRNSCFETLRRTASESLPPSASSASSALTGINRPLRRSPPGHYWFESTNLKDLLHPIRRAKNWAHEIISKIVQIKNKTL